jgi:hypothetical protein
MFLNKWWGLFARSRSHQHPAKSGGTIRFRPQAEALEDRTAPAHLSTDNFLFTPINLDVAHGSGIAIHIHPHVTIFIDGQQQEIPANIGVNVSADTVLPVHTHDNTGTLHVESTDATREFHLQDLFAVWGQTFSSTKILGHAATVSMTVDGQPSTAFGDLILQDDQQIVIQAQTVTTPPPEQLPEPPSGLTPTQAYVNQLYRDLFGRNADPAGLEVHSTGLDQGRFDRSQLVMFLQNSLEYRVKLAEGLYQHILGRSVDPIGLNLVLAFMARGGTVHQVEAALYGSEEYFVQRGGGNNAGFLQALYRDLLGREIDPSGAQSWGEWLARGATREWVVLTIMGHPEPITNEVQSLYGQFLDRQPDASGQGSFATLLQPVFTKELAMMVMLASDEFFQKANGG